MKRLRRVSCALLYIAALAGGRAPAALAGTDWLPYHTSSFNDVANPAWTASARGGSVTVSGGWAVLETPWSTTQYPQLYRVNGYSGDGGRLFPASGDFRTAIQFQYGFPSGVAGYGVDLWAGTVSCGTSSYWCRNFNVYMHRDAGFRLRLLPTDWGDELYLGPIDTTVHLLEVTKVGSVWTAYVDGVQRMQRTNAGTHPERPNEVFFGDPTTMWWPGVWPTLRVDYVRVDTDSSVCITGVAPASPQPPNTSVTVTAQGRDGLGIGRIEFRVNAAADGSASGAWWTFGTATVSGAPSTTQVATLNWAYAPAGFSGVGTHRLGVRLFDSGGALRRDEAWSSCAWQAYAWPAPTATPTATATATATPTATPSPTPTPTVVPIQVHLFREHGTLLLFGPRLGQPAQRLYGQVSGGSGPPYTVRLNVTWPGGAVAMYDVATDGGGNFQLGTAESTDDYFGTNAIGTWSARASVAGVGSNEVNWAVNWFPVNERP